MLCAKTDAERVRNPCFEVRTHTEPLCHDCAVAVANRCPFLQQP